MKIKQILEGWGNLALDKFNLLSEETKQLATARLEVCNGCPIRTGNTCDTNKAIMNEVTNQMVNGCGCSLSAKTLSQDSHCPASKWENK